MTGRHGHFDFLAALGVLLTTESLIFAALTLTLTVLEIARGRVLRLPSSPLALSVAIVVVLGLVAAGAFVAWSQVFTGSVVRPWPQATIAIALLIAIVAQPIVALALVLGFRRHRPA